MDDIHDQLVKAYLDYFKANEWWERKRSVRAYYAVQKSIREIKELATLRNREVRDQHQTKSDSTKK